MSQALHTLSAVELARQIAHGKVSAREALEYYLDRVDRLNGPLNIMVWQDRDGARKRADALDAARKAGAPLGPLHGVPMTTKESYQIAGSPTTFGVEAMRDNVTQTNALAVDRLNVQGVNIFGKTNVPVRLADFQSYNPIYGTTNNPWDPTRTPGGSSGGSAAALAAGLSSLEIGSDIGGSIRNPAHFSGVFGHKPTWNLCPPRGHALDGTLTPTDISVIGPLARSAYDLEVTLKAMAGPDEIDVPGLSVNLPNLNKATKDLRVAVWGDGGPICPTSSRVAARIAAVVEALGRAGAHVDERARPGFSAEETHEVFNGLLLPAMANRLPDADFAALVERASSGDSNSPAVATARWQTQRHRDWVKNNEARSRLRWAWRRFFNDYDFMITPIMPITAYKHDHSPEATRTTDVDGTIIPYFNMTFWAGVAGVSLLPATAFPAGCADDGLPVGLQIIGPAYSDLQTIQLAQRLEGMGFGFLAPKGYE